MNIHVREDPVESGAVIALLERHLDLMRSQTPPGHVHALDLNGLRASDVTMWTAWRGDDVVGCAALKALDDCHGEIKSMHVLANCRDAGVGSLLVHRLVAAARLRRYRRLHLETGAQQAFERARGFYKRHGFVDSGPFGDYSVTAWSAFMTLELDA